MIHLQDEPIGDPVCVPVYYVSELARKNGVTVCQVGEGSDELFWGYPEWKSRLRLQEMNDWPVPRFIKQMGLAGASLLGHGDNYRAEQLRRGIAGVPIFWSGAEAFTETQKRPLLSPRLRARFSGLSSWDVLAPIHQRFREKAWDQSPLPWMTFVDLNLRLPELLLMRVDKMSMGVSLEARVPFLYHKFVELAMSIPSAVKTRNGELKHILKRAVRGLVPGEIIDRKKQGFGVPIREWFIGNLGEQARNVLTEFCRHTDYFDAQALELYLRPEKAGPAWFLLNFALWWNEYIAPGTLTSAGDFAVGEALKNQPIATVLAPEAAQPAH
jgi:asparagine synthase (glutamine-hydrolysing)